MNLSHGIFALLSTAAPLGGAKVYPDQLPENPTLPALEYQWVGGGGKPSLNASGPQRWRLQVNAWGSTFDSAETLKWAVLNGYRGTLSDGTLVQFIQLIGPIRLSFENDAREFGCGVEFYVHFCFNF